MKKIVLPLILILFGTTMELTIIQEPIKLTIKPVQEQSICLEEPQ